MCYLSIYDIYVTSLQANFCKALPAQVRAKISFKELVKVTGQMAFKRAEFRWETVPSSLSCALLCGMTIPVAGGRNADKKIVFPGKFPPKNRFFQAILHKKIDYPSKFFKHFDV